MSEEAAFLRAIQANPTDMTAKLVYADWLDEHGESAKARYVRYAVAIGYDPTENRVRPHAEQQELAALTGPLSLSWLDLFHCSSAFWDEITLLGLGRLEGFLSAFEMCSHHAADVNYVFTAHLLPHRGNLQELVDGHYERNHRIRAHPKLVRVDNWEGELRGVLDRGLFAEMGRITTPTADLAIQEDYGRDNVLDTAMRHVTSIITPTNGWWVNNIEAIGARDLVLEAADRVLFLHFGFSD